MPTKLGEYSKYVVGGLRTLPEEDLNLLPNGTALSNVVDTPNLEGTVDRLTKKWRLYEKVDIMVRGIQATDLAPDDKRYEWGLMLLSVNSANISQATDVSNELAQYNQALNDYIEEDYVPFENLLREIRGEVNYRIDTLEGDLDNQEFRTLSKDFPTIDGLVRFVKRESVGEFRRIAARVIEQQEPETTVYEGESKRKRTLGDILLGLKHFFTNIYI